MKKLLCAILALLLVLAGFALAEESVADELLAKYDLVGRLFSGYFVVRLDGKWGMTDPSGTLVQATQLCEEPVFEDGYAVAAMYSGAVTREFSGIEEEAKLYGVIDAKGVLRIPIRYDSVELSEGIALAREGEDYRYLTMDGAPINDEAYYRAEPFLNGYAAVGRKIESAALTSDPFDALWGAIDSQGRQVIPFQYDSLVIGDGGPALVSQRDDTGAEKYGFVDMEGNAVTELQYDAAEPFSRGVAAVCKRIEGKADDSDDNSAAWGAIDANGNELLPMEYDYVTVRADGFIEAEQGNETLIFSLDNGKAMPAEIF